MKWVVAVPVGFRTVYSVFKTRIFGFLNFRRLTIFIRNLSKLVDLQELNQNYRNNRRICSMKFQPAEVPANFDCGDLLWIFVSSTPSCFLWRSVNVQVNLMRNCSLYVAQSCLVTMALAQVNLQFHFEGVMTSLALSFVA